MTGLPLIQKTHSGGTADMKFVLDYLEKAYWTMTRIT